MLILPDIDRTFKTEAELCAAFIRFAKSLQWTAYPECCGWDILMVRDDGCQLGVQAKLKPTLEVLAQATRCLCHPKAGPDYCAILVPGESRKEHYDWWNGRTPYSRGVGRQQSFRTFTDVCRALKLVTIYRDAGKWKFDLYDFHRQTFEARHELPKYIPDVIAGAPCPIQLTDWKIKAIRLCRTLRHRGYLTSADFKAEAISAQRWLNRWIVGGHVWKDAEAPHVRGNREWRYTALPGTRLPDEDHPVVSAQIDVELGFTTVVK
jgi:hypothetical protein